ncbi:MAG TPA: hypothetical protein VGR78_13225 [Verrucomicrobiae bacterium]|nr:hypothetical protein [Verrucomicrobiae bacterium]
MKTGSILLSISVLLLTALKGVAQFAPSTSDVWDVSRGTILILSSDLDSPNAYDMRDMFGGSFGTSAAEKGNVVFAHGAPEGSVNVIEWRTKTNYAIKSFRLFAYDDPGTMDHGMGLFRLSAKSAGSPTFDTVLYEFTPAHPYHYEDAAHQLLIAANVKPVQAQEFKAEFTTWNGQSGPAANGPRVVELDGLTDFIGLEADTRVSEMEVGWPSAPGVLYQVEYRENLSSSTWQKLGSPVTGTGNRMTIADKVLPGNAERFYRVLPLQ